MARDTHTHTRIRESFCAIFILFQVNPNQGQLGDLVNPLIIEWTSQFDTRDERVSRERERETEGETRNDDEEKSRGDG